MSIEQASVELSQKQFSTISEFVYRVSRINLTPGKEGLVRTRLAKRIRELGLGGFGDYIELVMGHAAGEEPAVMVDLLTTNKTSFFRENRHFDLLANSILPAVSAGGRPFRIWSAGCSSGEEAYTLAMLLHDHLPEAARPRAKVLATDISARVLARARSGVYPEEAVREIPGQFRRRFLQPAQGVAGSFAVDPRIRSMVSFARLNLMDPWPMQGPFDVVFCRNVMIYFDRETQEQLVGRFYEKLSPGGHLFVGHSESLSSLSHEFSYVQPAVYIR